MSISRKLREFLSASHVKYTAMKHPVAYTAQELAAAQHVPGRQVAKSVLVNTTRGNVLAVLPAITLIDFKKLKRALGGGAVSIAKERDIKAQFPDVEVGAMSPFGNLYGVAVVVDQALSESEEIAFNAGSHTDTIKMRYRDFAALVTPKVGAFGQYPKSARRTSSRPAPPTKLKAKTKTRAGKR